MDRVLVTGGAGFIGSHIIDQLVAQRGAREIVAVDNLVRGRRENLAWAMANGPVSLIEGDICDRELMAGLIAGTDVLFHMAALRITHCAQEPRLAMSVMVEAPYEIFRLAAEAGVSKVVAASSASIYGMADSFPTRESSNPYDNRTFYGAAKLFNEGLLRSFNDMFGLDYVALRYFNAYGTRMDIHGAYTEVLVRWMDRIAEGKPPLIFGDGKQTMDFISVEDIARANLLAARSEVSDEVFNIASGTETSLAELAEALLAVMGSNLRPEFGPERKVNPVQRRLADVGKARERLGFEATIGLDDGLKRLVDWWAQERSVRDAG